MLLFVASFILTTCLILYGIGYPDPTVPGYSKQLQRKGDALLAAAITSLPSFVVMFFVLRALGGMLTGEGWHFYGFAFLESLSWVHWLVAFVIVLVPYLGLRYNNFLRARIENDVYANDGEKLRPGHPIYDLARALTDQEGMAPPDVYLMLIVPPNIAVTVLGTSKAPIIFIDRRLAQNLTHLELGAILLHELGHVYYKDINRRILFMAVQNGLCMTTLAFAFFSILSITGFWGALAIAITWLSSKIFMNLLLAAATRRSELNADAFSARRFDPQLLIDGLDKVESCSTPRDRAEPTGWQRHLLSHPSVEIRKAAMQRLHNRYKP